VADQQRRTDESQQPRKPEPSASGIPAASVLPRPGVLALGVLLIVGNVYWMRLAADASGSGLGLTQYALFPNVAALLFLLVLASRVLIKRSRRWGLRPQELVALYVMLAVATSLCAYDFLYYLPQMVAYGKWSALQSDRWAEWFGRAFPPHLVITDTEAVRDYFVGRSSLYQADHVLAWLTPLLWWLLFVIAAFLGMLCLSRLLLPRWDREEKLAFPLAAFPQIVALESDSLLADRLLWIGFGLSLGIELVNLAHGIWPALPGLPMVWDLTPVLGHVRPWLAQRYLVLGLTPLVFGLSFLAPLDLCLSLWLFNLLWRAAAILGFHYGLSEGSSADFPFVPEQSIGGCVALVGSFLWLGRRYLKRLLAQLLGLAGSSEEAKPIRLATLGLAAAGAFLTYFCLRAGLSGRMTIAVLCFYTVVMLATTRLRVQLGSPSVELEANVLLPKVIGSARLAQPELGMLTLFSPLTFSTRSTPMGVQMEGLYLFSRAGLSGQGRVILLSGLVGVLASLWAALDVGYRIGIGSGHASLWATRQPGFSFGYLSAWLENPAPSNFTALEALAAGALITAGLAAAAARWPTWPLHPVGFVLSGSFAIYWMLPAIFAAWLTKTLVMRYGGVRAYRRALRLCLGLIVGSSLGSMVAIALGQLLHAQQ